AGCIEIVKTRESRRGNVVFGAQFLGEALGALKLRGCLVRTKRPDASGSQIIDEAIDKRRLGANDDQADALNCAERQHCSMVAYVENNILAERRRAGIPRSDEKPSAGG